MKLLITALLAAAATPATLKPMDITLPDDEAQFVGADADLLNGNCTACHSPSMILYQPRMDAAHWAESVKKMRETYKAPIEDSDAALLPAALARAQSNQATYP